MKFLDLPAADLHDAYLAGAELTDKSPTVLEKDVWVCWALDALFTCPGLPRMAFKGGTSLSKVYGVITRFSEDIDVTMHCEDLIDDLDPFEAMSRKRRDKVDEQLRAKVREHAVEQVVPHLQACLAARGLQESTLEIIDDGAELHIGYPSALDERDPYYLEVVKLEFGGRNMTEPCETFTLRPYLATALTDFEYPEAAVDVLAVARTFWEKFTLAHAESRKPEFKNADRMSRHWYDLAVLSVHDLGIAALDDLALLEDVVKVKTRFFNSGSAQYALCLSGEASLLPGDDGLEMLKADYTAMVNVGMIVDPLPFDEIVDRILELQAAANVRTAQVSTSD